MRFDVYRRSDAEGFLLDVQADLLRVLKTRVVVPLLPEHSAPRPAARLNPIFVVSGRRVVMATQFLAAIPTGELRVVVANLDAAHTTIVDALDMLFSGF